MGFTKIFKMMNYSIISNQSSYSIANVPFKDIGGNDRTGVFSRDSLIYTPSLFAGVSNSVSPGISESVGNNLTTYFFIGSGDTPFTDADYTLAQRITSGISFSVSATGYATYDNSLGKVVRTAAVTVNTTENITIKEIGLAKYVYTAYNLGYLTLMYREVLSTPISLAAGQSVTLALSVVGG